MCTSCRHAFSPTRAKCGSGSTSGTCSCHYAPHLRAPGLLTGRMPRTPFHLCAGTDWHTTAGASTQPSTCLTASSRATRGCAALRKQCRALTHRQEYPEHPWLLPRNWSPLGHHMCQRRAHNSRTGHQCACCDCGCPIFVCQHAVSDWSAAHDGWWPREHILRAGLRHGCMRRQPARLPRG